MNYVSRSGGWFVHENAFQLINLFFEKRETNIFPERLASCLRYITRRIENLTIARINFFKLISNRLWSILSFLSLSSRWWIERTLCGTYYSFFSSSIFVSYYLRLYEEKHRFLAMTRYRRREEEGRWRDRWKVLPVKPRATDTENIKRSGLSPQKW